MSLPWEGPSAVAATADAPAAPSGAVSPYGRARPHSAARAVPLHLRPGSQVPQFSGGPRQDGGGALAPSLVESTGVLSIPHKRRIAEPDHRVYTPVDRIQEENMRYYSDSYVSRHTHMHTLAHVRTDSTGVRACIDEKAPPPPPGKILDEFKQARKGHGVGRPAEDVHRTDHVASLLHTHTRAHARAQPAAGDDTSVRDAPAPPRAPDSVRPDTAAHIAAYLGNGVSDALGRSAPKDYGWGRYGLHAERQSSKGGVAERRHYYAQTLAGENVASLLIAGAAGASADAAPAPTRVEAVSDAPVASGRPGTAPASAASRAFTGGSKGGGTHRIKYARELRGHGDLVEDAPVRAPDPVERFTTTYRATHVGAREGGPRQRTPPRRQLGFVYSSKNDPYRPTAVV